MQPTSRSRYNLQGVVLLQTAFSKKINSAFTVWVLYRKIGEIATCPYAPQETKKNELRKDMKNGIIISTINQ